MSVPPQILRIKRKRDDEPVDALYIEPSNKRSNIANYCFRRVVQQESQPKPSSTEFLISNYAAQDHGNGYHLPPPRQATASNGIPQIMATKPGEENTLFRAQSSKPVPGSSTRAGPNFREKRNSIQSPHDPPVGDEVHGSRQQPRRFHLSMVQNKQDAHAPLSASESKNVLPAAHGNGADPSANRRKRKADSATVTVFVEERSEQAKRSVAQIQTTHAAADARVRQASPIKSDNNLLDITTEDAMDVDTDIKTPGTSITNSTHLQVTAITDEDYIFDTYVLHKQSDQPPRHDINSIATTTSRTSSALPPFNIDHNNNKIKASSTMDTYTSAPSISGSIGYLVIDDATSADFWYADDENGDEDGVKNEGDWDSEQDDENAENYYAADYPDEEDEDAESGDDGEAGLVREFGGMRIGARGGPMKNGKGEGISDDEDDQNSSTGNGDDDDDEDSMNASGNDEEDGYGGYRPKSMGYWAKKRKEWGLDRANNHKDENDEEADLEYEESNEEDRRDRERFQHGFV